MLRVLLADDDVISQTKIRRFLEDEHDISLIADCSDGVEAGEKLKILEPDIVILDIELPGMSGFEILESIRGMKMPYVIVMSRHDKYAIRAFEFCVTDYLVKPFDKRRFREALIKVRRYLERDARAENRIITDNEPANGSNDLIHPSVERIPIKKGRRVQLVHTSAIRHIVADRDFTNLYMITGETIHTSERISQLEIKLPAEKFQRIQRSVIVNLEHIQEIRSKKGKYEFVMSNGESFMSGVLYKRELNTLVTTWSKHQRAA